ARPYLTDVQIDWGGLPVANVTPERMPDLSALQPLVVMGRYRGDKAVQGTVTLRGRIAGRPYEQRIEVKLPDVAEEHVAVGRLWARARIAERSRGEHARPRAHEVGTTR